jgi:hypothetical protein
MSASWHCCYSRSACSPAAHGCCSTLAMHLRLVHFCFGQPDVKLSTHAEIKHPVNNYQHSQRTHRLPRQWREGCPNVFHVLTKTFVTCHLRHQLPVDLEEMATPCRGGIVSAGTGFENQAHKTWLGRAVNRHAAANLDNTPRTSGDQYLLAAVTRKRIMREAYKAFRCRCRRRCRRRPYYGTVLHLLPVPVTPICCY